MIDPATVKLRDRLVEAVVPHIPFDGWGEAALRAAARDIGIDEARARRLFPRLGLDLVTHFSDQADRRMEALLGENDLQAMRLRDRVALAVRLRLESLNPHREAVRLAFGVMTLPPHGLDGLRCLYRTVDAIWFAIGDRSTDVNFYTKRLLLAGVYLSTVLCWVGDESEGLEETWAFLARRIDDVMRLQKTRGRIERAMGEMPSPFMLLRLIVREGRAGRRGPRGASV
ncbi:MAG: COQ9 family protein [Alphaproteobacteria bacterium]